MSFLCARRRAGRLGEFSGEACVSEDTPIPDHANAYQCAVTINRYCASGESNNFNANFGRLGDGRLVFTISTHSGKVAYMVEDNTPSQEESARLAEEKRHNDAMELAAKNSAADAADTKLLAQDLVNDRIQTIHHEESGNNYAARAVKKNSKKLAQGGLIKKVGWVGKIAYALSGKNQNVKDRANNRINDLTGFALDITGTDPNVVGAQANIDSMQAACIRTGGCVQQPTE